jgi:hypothetical protein
MSVPNREDLDISKKSCLKGLQDKTAEYERQLHIAESIDLSTPTILTLQSTHYETRKEVTSICGCVPVSFNIESIVISIWACNNVYPLRTDGMVRRGETFPPEPFKVAVKFTYITDVRLMTEIDIPLLLTLECVHPTLHKHLTGEETLYFGKEPK